VGSPQNLLLVYLVTAVVPSLTACLASSPGRSNLMAVWISRELTVDFLLLWTRREASVAMLEDIVDKRVHDAHGFAGDTSVRVNLLQHLVDVDSIAFLSLSPFHLLFISGGICLTGFLLEFFPVTLGTMSEEQKGIK